MRRLGNEVTITSEFGGVLELSVYMSTYMPPTGYDLTINDGDWVFLGAGYVEVIAQADFTRQFIVKT